MTQFICTDDGMSRAWFGEQSNGFGEDWEIFSQSAIFLTRLGRQAYGWLWHQP